MKTEEQVRSSCGHPGCGKPIVYSIDGWMHEYALDQWLSDEAHAATPQEDAMTQPNDETTVLTPVGDDKMVEQDPHDWLEGDDVDDDDDFDDVPLPPGPEEDSPLSIAQRENVAALQEASRVLRLMTLGDGNTVTVKDIIEVARFIKGEKD